MLGSARAEGTETDVQNHQYAEKAVRVRELAASNAILISGASYR